MHKYISNVHESRSRKRLYITFSPFTTLTCAANGTAGVLRRLRIPRVSGLSKFVYRNQAHSAMRCITCGIVWHGKTPACKIIMMFSEERHSSCFTHAGKQVHYKSSYQVEIEWPERKGSSLLKLEEVLTDF